MSTGLTAGPGQHLACSPERLPVKDPLHEKRIRCPYCGERLHVVIDTSAGDQTYIEDCQVCCRPMRIDFAVDENEILYLNVSSDN